MLSAYAMQLAISHSMVTAVVSDYQLVYLHQSTSDPVTMQTELIYCRSMLFIVWSTVVVRLPYVIQPQTIDRKEKITDCFGA